jgi:hypothetical protein
MVTSPQFNILSFYLWFKGGGEGGARPVLVGMLSVQLSRSNDKGVNTLKQYYLAVENIVADTSYS